MVLVISNIIKEVYILDLFILPLKTEDTIYSQISYIIIFFPKNQTI